MTCETVRPMIEEYFDGELDAKARRGVEAHLETCAACSAEYAALEREQLLFARYDRGFEPSRDLWEGVRARIEREAPLADRSGEWFRSLSAWFGSLMTPARLVPVGVAALALVVSVSTGILFLRSEPVAPPETAGVETPVVIPSTPPTPPAPADQSPREEPPQEPKSVEKAPGAKPGVRVKRPRGDVDPQLAALPAPVADAERQYLQAIALLNKDIERSSVGLDEETREDWSKPLEALDRNIEAARRAVRRNPDDPAAVVSMLSAYDSKVETLQTMALLQAANDE